MKQLCLYNKSSIFIKYKYYSYCQPTLLINWHNSAKRTECLSAEWNKKKL